MLIKDPIAWQEWCDNNTDPYGGEIIAYAKRWAESMEVRMESGATLEECAESTSHEADINGISGFMYGAAICVLASCWEHGESLRRWANSTVQLGNEGDEANEKGTILNPALLRMENL